MENQSKAVEFIFQDTQIHFLLGNEKNVMVNATEMAKVFGKDVDKFLRLESTKNFISRLIERENSKIIPPDVGGYLQESDVIFGRKRGGTYMHRKVALKFAAWLDVNFELWIIDTIETILFGKAKTAAESIEELSRQELKVKKLHEYTWTTDNDLAKEILTENLLLAKMRKCKIKDVGGFVKSHQTSLF